VCFLLKALTKATFPDSSIPLKLCSYGAEFTGSLLKAHGACQSLPQCIRETIIRPTDIDKIYLRIVKRKYDEILIVFMQTI